TSNRLNGAPSHRIVTLAASDRLTTSHRVSRPRRSAVAAYVPTWSVAVAGSFHAWYRPSHGKSTPSTVGAANLSRYGASNALVQAPSSPTSATIISPLC